MTWTQTVLFFFWKPSASMTRIFWKVPFCIFPLLIGTLSLVPRSMAIRWLCALTGCVLLMSRHASSPPSYPGGPARNLDHCEAKDGSDLPVRKNWRMSSTMRGSISLMLTPTVLLRAQSPGPPHPVFATIASISSAMSWTLTPSSVGTITSSKCVTKPMLPLSSDLDLTQYLNT